MHGDFVIANWNSSLGIEGKEVKFIYSEKDTKILRNHHLSNVVMVKSTSDILQNFVAFSEYMNFNLILLNELSAQLASYWNKRRCNRKNHRMILIGLMKWIESRETFLFYLMRRTLPLGFFICVKDGQIPDQTDKYLQIHSFYWIIFNRPGEIVSYVSKAGRRISSAWWGGHSRHNGVHK